MLKQLITSKEHLYVTDHREIEVWIWRLVPHDTTSLKKQRTSTVPSSIISALYKKMSRLCQIIIAHSLLAMHLPTIIQTKGAVINKDPKHVHLSYFWHILADLSSYTKSEAVR